MNNYSSYQLREKILLYDAKTKLKIKRLFEEWRHCVDHLKSKKDIKLIGNKTNEN